ncbi:MAG TPA: Uma2 family endonuclease [Gemmataceae bacterium]|jgi:Uma2 family endonuclease|nr:Uma2 family endonuclease [Gemmataceae bacterium]
MNTIIAPPVGHSLPPWQRPLTIADVAALPSSLPSGDVRYELDNGRLVIMPPPGADHGSGQSLIGMHLVVQGQFRGHGKAFAEVGIILRRNPDSLVGADNAFVCKQSLPIKKSPEGYLETIPELVVEIRSKNDTTKEIEDKVTAYDQAGVLVVWVPDPATRTVTVYRAGQESVVLQANDVLTVPDLIPGFQVTVRDLFDS